MKKIFQLWGMEPDILSKDEILSRVDRMLEAGPMALVAGQSQDRAFLKEICRRAHAAGVKVHQWASLFSENDGAYPWEPLIGADGRRQRQNENGQFNFRCPASEKNVDWFIQMQKEAMQDVPFDGVFIDRVRYPWLTSGELACFCPDCVRRYEAAGLDVEKLPRMKDFSITGFEGDRPVFSDEEIRRFFDLRAQIITRAALKIKAAFGEISLDFFPPALAYLVGQDLRALAKEALFVKPMLYRYTDAPAGLPYEMKKAPFPMPEAEQVKQYEAVWPDLYWGVEGGRIPPIVEMTPERIRETLELVEKGGVCAAWAAATFPQENLEVFLRV